DKTARSVGFSKAFADDAEHDLVVHQRAGIHDSLGAQTVFGTALNRRAQQIAGGDLRDFEMLDQTLSLGALSRAGGPHEYNLHGETLPADVLQVKPIQCGMLARPKSLLSIRISYEECCYAQRPLCPVG